MSVPHRPTAKSFKLDKGCIVNSATITPKGVMISYRCGNDGHGSDLPYDTADGGRSNYPSTLLTGATSIHVDGATVSGVGARVGFVVSPGKATCRKKSSDRQVVCKVYTPGAGLGGTRRRRRR